MSEFTLKSTKLSVNADWATVWTKCICSVNGQETFLFSNLSILTFTLCFISSAYQFLLYEGKYLYDVEVNGIFPFNAFVNNTWRYTFTP